MDDYRNKSHCHGHIPSSRNTALVSPTGRKILWRRPFLSFSRCCSNYFNDVPKQAKRSFRFNLGALLDYICLHEVNIIYLRFARVMTLDLFMTALLLYF